ncbi:hypothetical protein V8G54_025076 [Vigna mungo]|uniref:Uncharacterized protein n=1 Tax=Vigna mungo TaxID=3915 RepID=A0AAQ3N8C6_VIGMU
MYTNLHFSMILLPYAIDSLLCCSGTIMAFHLIMIRLMPYGFDFSHSLLTSNTSTRIFQYSPPLTSEIWPSRSPSYPTYTINQVHAKLLSTPRVSELNLLPFHTLCLARCLRSSSKLNIIFHLQTSTNQIADS